MRVPTHILNAATGVSEAILDQLKRLPQVKAPGTGAGLACRHDLVCM